MTGTGSRSEVQIMKHGRTRRARLSMNKTQVRPIAARTGEPCCHAARDTRVVVGRRRLRVLPEPSNSISMFRRRRFALVHRLHRNFTSKAWPIVGAHASRITRRHTRRLRFGLHRSLLDGGPDANAIHVPCFTTRDSALWYPPARSERHHVRRMLGNLGE